MLGSVFANGASSARILSVVESLEDRRLLCATGISNTATVAALHSGIAIAAVRAPLSLASAATVKKPVVKPKPKGPQPTITPSMVHDYVGKITKKGPFGVKLFSVDFEMKVTGQTLTSLTGIATVSGSSITGSLTGKLLTNRKFVFKISGKGLAFAMAGTLSKTGAAIAGTASFAVAAGASPSITSAFKASGNFLATAQ